MDHAEECELIAFDRHGTCTCDASGADVREVVPNAWRAPKDGDVFSWSYTDEVVERRKKFWGDHTYCNLYHCKSRIATFKNGVLRDTFWGSLGDGALDPTEVTLTFRGNIGEMTVIPPYETEFYRDDDIVDMRHSNSSGELVFRKPGTARDQEKMRAYFERKIADAESDIRLARNRQDECCAALMRIESGDVVGSFPMWSK